jgi:hypothetical protein
MGIMFKCRRKKIKDVDESKWESKGDGVVVRSQPQGNNYSFRSI